MENNIRSFRIIDFYTDWCAPCKTLSPILEELSIELGVEINKINIDENDEVAEFYNVRSIPTLIFIKDNLEVGRHIGMIQKEKLKEKILYYEHSK